MKIGGKERIMEQLKLKRLRLKSIPDPNVSGVKALNFEEAQRHFNNAQVFLKSFLKLKRLFLIQTNVISSSF